MKLLSRSRRLPADAAGVAARTGAGLAAASEGSWARIRACSSRNGRPGVDAQLVGQAVADFGVGVQGVGLPPGPVEREDEQFPQALAQRVLAALRLQLAGELPVAAQHQVRSGAGFDRHQGQLVQLRPFGVGEAGVGEFGQRLAPPQAERLAQRGRRQRHLALLRQPPSLRHQLLEADDVDLIGTDGEGIAGFGSDDRARSQGAAQLADLGLQRVSRVRRLPVTPQRVDQPVGADRLAAMQRQQGQQRPLLGAADSERHAPVRCLELAEQPHVHDLHRTALTRPPLGGAAGHQGSEEARAEQVQRSDQALGHDHA